MHHVLYNNALFKKYIGIYDYVDVILNPLRKYIANSISESEINILDVACGTGSLLKFIDDKNKKVVGIDISEDMLGVAKTKLQNKTNTKLEIINSAETKFPDGEFDLSIISFALHDMPLDMAYTTLLEMKRITKNGGRIIIADYSDKSIFHIIPFIWESKYYGEFINTGISNVMKEMGMNVKSRKYFLFGAVEVNEISN